MQLKILSLRNVLLILFLSASILYSQESLFPPIPKWQITQNDPVYQANNLWDIIDGAADLYLEYGFVDLHIARYLSTDSIEIKAELYRHASERDAFGMYSQERDTGYNFIPLGVQGYLQQGVLNFLTGSYYIKLSTYQMGSNAQDAMLAIGKGLVKHLKQNNTMPALYRVFPGEGKLSNTEQYVARNFLGYSCLNSVYTTLYNDRAPFKVFVIESTDPEKANAILTEYLKVISKDNVTKLTIDKYQIQDPHNGFIGLQIFKRYICGVINCPDIEVRDRYLKEVTTALLRLK